MHNIKYIILLLVYIISFIKIAALPASTESSINDSHNNILDVSIQQENNNNGNIKSKREDIPPFDNKYDQYRNKEEATYLNVPVDGTLKDQVPSNPYKSTSVISDNTENNSYNNNNAYNKDNGGEINYTPNINVETDNKKQNFFLQYKIYIMVLIIILLVLIILITGVLLYRRKYRRNVLMDKIEANDYDIINISFNDMSMQTKVKPISDIKTNELIKDDEQYNFKPANIEFLQKGLKPAPPSHERKQKKKKNLKANNKSPSSVATTFPRNKSLNVPKLFKPSNRESYLSDASVAPTMISQVSSNGGGLYSYKNNTINKHISVALTFGFNDKDEEESIPPQQTCPTPNSRVSVVNSKVGSPRSFASYISTSPIAQSFNLKRFFPASPRRTTNYVVIENTKKSDLEGTIYLNDENKYSNKLSHKYNQSIDKKSFTSEKTSTNKVKFSSSIKDQNEEENKTAFPSEVESIINIYDSKSEVYVVNQE